MEKITTHGYELGLFDGSISDLPEARHHELNLAILLESGIGSDLPAFQAKLAMLNELIQRGSADDKKKATQIINNLYIQVGQTMETPSFQSLALAALVKEIEGQDVSLLSAEKVRGMLDLRKIQAGPMRRFIAAAKKKLWLKWSSIFQTYRGAPAK